MTPRRVWAALAAVALILAALAGCGSGGGADSLDTSPLVPDRAFGVFVGIEDYPVVLTDVSGCDEDAGKIWESLSGAAVPWPQSAQAASAQIRLLTWPPLTTTSNGTRLLEGAVGAPSREGILQAIGDVAALMTPRDLFVFYFSGHAEYDPRAGRAYLHTSGTRWDIISDSELASALAAVPRNGRAANVVLILDACQTGAFADAAATWPGVEVLASSTADEDSLARNGSSLFTSALVQGLGRGDVIGPGDANADGAITPSELFQHARWATERMSDGQHPVLRGPGQLREMALKFRPSSP